MECPACGSENPENKRFCADCGSPLGAPRCESCGAELIAGKAFCADCGTPVGQATRRRPSDAYADTRPSGPGDTEGPVAERRICSVLFVDLVGFTPLSERRDPEQIRDLLSVYFDRAQTIIGHYGGVVEKFIGDAVMAVWGAPVANEDDAERAVRAGLEVVASVSELGAESGIPELLARGGVVTGEVAITIGKISEGMVLGDTVNSASRVQSAAEPGTVLVDESTWRAASGAIAFAEVGDLTLKGKAQPVHAWRALRVVARRRGLGRSEGLEAPFVGRDAELRLIKDLLHAMMTERRARLISITGVPGIGKSRLAWEFLKYVDGVLEPINWHQGRCPAYGDGVTFWALGEMVRMRAGINESDDAETSRAKLASSVAEFVGGADECRWIEPRLAHLLGIADAPSGDREEMFSAWRAYFEHISESAPTVMVFEDLQWADPGLIDFVESILEWSRNHPILVVTLARPELVDRRPTWGAGQRSFTSVHLEPLSDDAMRELLIGFVRGLPDEVCAQILERSEGVPLYGVEMVRSLLDRGVLTESDGAYSVTGDLASFELPGTLHALIGSRLDALPVEQRSLLQDAAVLGTTFSADALAVLQGVERSKLDADLRDLVRKEFLVIDTDPRSPERGQYGFVQALIQEVASSRLARRDRTAKHLAVARHFESLGDDELTIAIAAHYVEAFRAAPEGEAEPVAEAAREWLSLAGQRAKSLGSPEQALRLFDQALEMTAAGSDRARLLELAGAAADGGADYLRATELFEEAAALYRESGDANAEARAIAHLAGALTGSRRHVDAIAVARRPLEDGRDLDIEVRADLSTAIAMAYSQNGQGEVALEWVERSLQDAERFDDLALFSRALAVKSTALYQLGRHREAVIITRGMATIAESEGALVERALALTGLSVYALDDDPAGSLAAAVEAAEASRRAGHRLLELTNLLNAAESAAYLGDFVYARRAIDELSQRDLTDEHRGWLQMVEAVVLASNGSIAEARQLIDRIREDGLTEYVHMRATYFAARAEVLWLAGDLAGARSAAADGVRADPLGINASKCLALEARACTWQRDRDGTAAALAALESFRGRWAAASRRTAEAGLAALDGEVDRALERYRAAFDAWSALDDAFERALAELDAVMILGPQVAGRAIVDDARSTFERVGATPLVERLDEADSVR